MYFHIFKMIFILKLPPMACTINFIVTLWGFLVFQENLCCIGVLIMLNVVFQMALYSHIVISPSSAQEK
jgi:hypothetical protein